VLVHGTGSPDGGANAGTQCALQPGRSEWPPEKAGNRGEKKHEGVRFITSAPEKSSTNTTDPGKELGLERKKGLEAAPAPSFPSRPFPVSFIFQISFLDKP